jgi:hypothetical protein
LTAGDKKNKKKDTVRHCCEPHSFLIAFVVVVVSTINQLFQAYNARSRSYPSPDTCALSSAKSPDCEQGGLWKAPWSFPTRVPEPLRGVAGHLLRCLATGLFPEWHQTDSLALGSAFLVHVHDAATAVLDGWRN